MINTYPAPVAVYEPDQKDKRVAALIVSYNMPERADALADAIERSAWPVDAIVIDNGSDIMPPARHTVLKLEKNIQTTRGWLAGWNYARDAYPYFAYMFCITSAEIVEGDVVADCAALLAVDDNAVGVHPALTDDSTTMWNHLKARSTKKTSGGAIEQLIPMVPRRTWMIDNICSMWRASFFEQHPFDPDLIYGHGIDLELCYNARKYGYSMWVHEGSRVRKITDIGYTMERMNMTAAERNRLAQENMSAVLGARYGWNYWNFLTTQYVTPNMR